MMAIEHVSDLSGFLPQQPEVCGPDSDFSGSVGDEECVEVGARVFAWYEDAWYAGEVVAVPDEDDKNQWTVQCDVDEPGIYTYTLDVVLSLDEEAGYVEPELEDAESRWQSLGYEAESPCSMSGVRLSARHNSVQDKNVGKLLLPSVLARDSYEIDNRDDDELTPTCASSNFSDYEEGPSFCLSEEGEEEPSFELDESLHFQDLPLPSSEESLCLEDLPLVCSEQRFASVSEARKESGICHFEETSCSTSKQQSDEPAFDIAIVTEMMPHFTVEIRAADSVEVEQPFQWEFPPLPASVLDEANDCVADLFDELRFLTQGLAEDAGPPARQHRAATKTERRAVRCQEMLRQAETDQRRGGSRLLRAMVKTAVRLDQA